MINFGIIGTSKIADQFVKSARLIPDFKLNAVYSRKYETGKEFAEKYDAQNVFTNLEDMAKSNFVDAVYIASPNSLHAQQAIKFLNNKKHVLCEKSMASNLKEVSAMVKAAKDNKVLLMEAMKVTFLPNFKIIKENLHKIGKVRRCFISYCQYSSRYDAYKEGNILNAFKPEFSNGAIMDIGTYCIQPLVNLFGKPNKIKASSLKLESGVDGEGSVILSYDDMEGVVIYSKISNSYIQGEIQGENGSIVFDKINPIEKVLIIYKDGRTEDISMPQRKESMYYEIKGFIQDIKSGKLESDINSHFQSITSIDIIENARKQTGIVFPADFS